MKTQALKMANFADRVICFINSLQFYPSPKIFKVPIVPLVTNSTSACASIVVREIVGCVFPKRLIGAELRVDRLPIGSRSIELAAGVDRKMRAP